MRKNQKPIETWLISMNNNNPITDLSLPYDDTKAVNGTTDEPNTNIDENTDESLDEI